MIVELLPCFLDVAHNISSSLTPLSLAATVSVANCDSKAIPRIDCTSKVCKALVLPPQKVAYPPDMRQNCLCTLASQVATSSATLSSHDACRRSSVCFLQLLHSSVAISETAEIVLLTLPDSMPTSFCSAMRPPTSNTHRRHD